MVPINKVSQPSSSKLKSKQCTGESEITSSRCWRKVQRMDGNFQLRQWIVCTLFSSKITNYNSKLRTEMKLELGKWLETIKILLWKYVSFFFKNSGWDLMNRKVKHLGFGHCEISRLKEILGMKVFGLKQYFSTFIFKLALQHHNNTIFWTFS